MLFRCLLGVSHFKDILRKNSLTEKLERLGKKPKVMADSHKRIGIKKKIGIDEYLREQEE